MRLLATLSIPESAAESQSFHYRDPISAPAPQQQPPLAWHSPVPYLFGGLAAMLGLIAFALLILACSYWKLSGYPERGDEDTNVDAGEKAAEETAKWEKKVVVIMAGQVMPTFLATPSTSRSSSFGSTSSGTTVQSCHSQNGEKLFEDSSPEVVGVGDELEL